MTSCPNLSDKKVKAEFDLLVRYFGEDLAYFIWDKTNGNGFLTEPNGAPSKIADKMRNATKQQRETALIEAAKKVVLNSSEHDSFLDLVKRDQEWDKVKLAIKTIDDDLKTKGWLRFDTEFKQTWRDLQKYKISSQFVHYEINFNYDQTKHRLVAKPRSIDRHDIERFYKVIPFNNGKTLQLNDDQIIDLINFLSKLTGGENTHSGILVEILRHALPGKKIRFEFVDYLPNNCAAKYDYFSRTIYISQSASFRNDSAFENILTQTIIHELIHVVTVDTISHNKELAADLLNLLDQVREKIDDKEQYGLLDIYEFLSELSSRDFVYKLADILINELKHKSLLDKAIDLVKKINRKILHFVSKNNLSGTAYDSAMNALIRATFPQGYGILREAINNDRISFASISALNKTDLEIAEGITKRFNVLYKAYEKMPNKSPRRQQLQNKIFEMYNELLQHQDIQAVRIALDFALESIGTIDVTTGKSTNKKSVLGYLQLESEKADPFSGVSPLNLVDMYSNSIGFYENLLENHIPDQINQRLSMEDRLKINSLRNSLMSAKSLWTQAMVVVGDKIVDELIDREVDADDVDKENMKIVAKDWLHKNVMYGDITGFTSYVFNYGYSTNPIIKQAFHLIQDAETQTLEEMHPIGQRLAAAFRKANKGFKSIGPNWLTMLQERDEHGIPTGYFIRPVNYGQYEIDLENFIKDLNDRFIKNYGHTYIDDGNGVIVNSLTNELADEEDWSNGEPLYVKYLKEIEHWKCERSHRRYTEAYYMERLSQPYKGSLDPYATNVNKFGHGLSPKALGRYNHIQSNINYYLDKCTDVNTGLSYPERLNDQDKASLDAWQKSLDDLSNPYNEDMTPKQDDERQIAFEIRAWQKWIGDKMSSEVNLDDYVTELQNLEQEAAKTGNYKPVYDFIKYNSSIGINPDFIEQTIGKFAKNNPTDQDVIHAQYLKQALQSAVKTKSGYTRDLSKMENRPEFWLNCKNMDQIIEDGKPKGDPAFAKEFEENFGFDEILYRDSYGRAIDSNGNPVDPKDEHLHNDLLTYQEYLINKYTNLAFNSPTRTILGLNNQQGNPIVFNGDIRKVRSTMEKLFSYRKQTVSGGNISVEYVPLTIFSMMVPKKDSFFNTRTNRQERTLLQVPKGRFAERFDKSNTYINKHYNKQDLNAEQPRTDYIENGVTRYDNSHNWSKVEKNKNVLALYNALIDTMQQAQDNYSTKNRRFNYRLPQINADSMLLMSRLVNNGFKNTAKALFDSITTVEENDESMRTADDYMTNPDGSIATDIPLKFVRKLKDPSRLTTDVVGSVVLFANMALNYKNKCAIDSKLKTLRYNMDSNFRSGVELQKGEFSPSDGTNSLEMFDSMLNNHMYNNQWTSKPQAGSDSKVLVAWNKALRKMHRLETTQMLALNLISMFVGFGDSTIRIFKESLMGKYMTIQDSVTALADIIVRYTLPVIANIGNPVANNKLTRAMLINGISKNVHQTYEHMNYGRGRKIVYNLLMGGFSMLDWMANALLLRSFYNNVRYYDGGVVPTGFYSLYELEQAFSNAGKSKKDAILAHTLCTLTLWGAYDNNMQLKPEFEPYVAQKTKTRIRTKTLQRSALYNGMNPDNDLPTYKTKLLGLFVGAMRGWLTLAVQHLFAGGSDNIVRNVHDVEDYKVKLIKTIKVHKTVADKLTDEQRARRMSWNYETGTPDDQIYVGLVRSFNTLGKKLWRYAHLDLAKAKDAKFSYVERYAWRDALVYMGVLALCIIGWPMLNEQAQAVPPPESREEAGPMSVSDIPRWFEEQYIGDQYWKLQVSDIVFRIIEAQITSIDPTSATDVVNSITTLNSGVNEHLGVVKAVGDVLGVSGHSTDEVVTQGGYKYYTRGERNWYKFIGPLDNLHTAFTYEGIKTNQQFYTNTYGGIYRFAGYDFKHEEDKKKKRVGPVINGPSNGGPKIKGPKIK